MSIETQGCHWVGAGNDDGGVDFRNRSARISDQTAEQQPKAAATESAQPLIAQDTPPAHANAYGGPPKCWGIWPEVILGCASKIPFQQIVDPPESYESD